jgi:hypothetical protein
MGFFKSIKLNNKATQLRLSVIMEPFTVNALPAKSCFRESQ